MDTDPRNKAIRVQSSVISDLEKDAVLSYQALLKHKTTYHGETHSGLIPNCCVELIKSHQNTINKLDEAKTIHFQLHTIPSSN